MIKTFCLCLPEYPEKVEQAKKHFAEQRLENVEFFHGLHAQTAGLSTEHTYEHDGPEIWNRIGYNSTGIWLSHWMLWNVLIHLAHDTVMILENDVKLCENWEERLSKALSDVPGDFGMLYVGSCCTEGHPKTHVSGDVWECKHMQCCHAYVIRRGALPTLLKMRKIWAPIDIQVQLECFPHLKTYVVLPRIFDQHNMTLSP